MSRLTGHIRANGPPAHLTPHDRLVGDVVVPPTMSLPARIYDQGSQNCTNYGYAALVEVWCAARGIECAPISKRFNYSLGRGLRDPGRPLVDLGANPNDVVAGMTRFGVVPEETCPGDTPDVINNPLDFYSLEVACTYKVSQVAAIDEDGAARCAKIRQSIAAKLPVGFAMEVYENYESWAGSATYSKPAGKFAGNHAQRIVAYRPGAMGIAGSWGTDVADGGFFWIDDSFIGSSMCFDFAVLNFAPAVHP